MSADFPTASPARSDLIPSCLLSHAGLGLHAPLFDSGKESGMVTFGLVRVRLGECGNSPVERILAAQVTTDLCRVAGARVRSRQGCRT